MFFLFSHIFLWVSVIKHNSFGGKKSGPDSALYATFCSLVDRAQREIKLYQLINSSNLQPLCTGVIDCREHKMGRSRPDEILQVSKASRNWP